MVRKTKLQRQNERDRRRAKRDFKLALKQGDKRKIGPLHFRKIRGSFLSHKDYDKTSEVFITIKGTIKESYDEERAGEEGFRMIPLGKEKLGDAIINMHNLVDKAEHRARRSLSDTEVIDIWYHKGLVK